MLFVRLYSAFFTFVPNISPGRCTMELLKNDEKYANPSANLSNIPQWRKRSLLSISDLRAVNQIVVYAGQRVGQSECVRFSWFWLPIWGQCTIFPIPRKMRLRLSKWLIIVDIRDKPCFEKLSLKKGFVEEKTGSGSVGNQKGASDALWATTCGCESKAEMVLYTQNQESDTARRQTGRWMRKPTETSQSVVLGTKKDTRRCTTPIIGEKKGDTGGR